MSYSFCRDCVVSRVKSHLVRYRARDLNAYNLKYVDNKHKRKEPSYKLNLVWQSVESSIKEGYRVKLGLKVLQTLIRIHCLVQSVEQINKPISLAIVEFGSSTAASLPFDSLKTGLNILFLLLHPGCWEKQDCRQIFTSVESSKGIHSATQVCVKMSLLQL